MSQGAFEVIAIALYDFAHREGHQGSRWQDLSEAHRAKYRGDARKLMSVYLDPPNQALTSWPAIRQAAEARGV